MSSRGQWSNNYGRDWPLHQRFMPAEGRDDPLGCDARPSWRGRVHMFGLFAAIPAVALLIVLSDGVRATVGASIYAAGVCAMFAASTTYHRWVYDFRARAAWRRADHAMIFAAIAGSATPIVLIVMPSGWGIGLLSVVWTVAVVGAVFKFGRWRRGDTIGSALYAAVSGLAALAIPALWVQGGATPAILCLVSGSLYIVGARWFAKTWPRLRPAVFSYHEVWHVLTVAAAAAHFAAVWAIST
ncbi:MAG: hemolysin III family protein [Actinomycetota bacterium]|nr:hemolysin III family protein [Actinomycetota bacterium]